MFMETVANSMIEGICFEREVSSNHRERFGRHLTSMARTHSIRSTMIGVLEAQPPESIQLCPEYLDLGKIDVMRTSTGISYLLRARSRKPPLVPTDLELFPDAGFRRRVLLYGIDDENLVFWSGAISILIPKGSKEKVVLLREDPVEEGRWVIPGSNETKSVFTEQEDDFGDLEDLDIDIEDIS